MPKIEAWDEEGGGALIPAFVEPLTHHDYGVLIKGGMQIEHGKAKLGCEWLMAKGSHHVEGRFVMSGPSGRHTLLIVSTPLERLNAHWIVFASHPDNQTEAAR